jgi:hypothetical protein
MIWPIRKFGGIANNHMGLRKLNEFAKCFKGGRPFGCPFF